jgi:hypothetical protein
MQGCLSKSGNPLQSFQQNKRDRCEQFCSRHGEPLTTNTPMTAPDRAVLRALYDEAIVEINTSRNTGLLTTDFYTKTADAVFDTGYLALSDATTDTRRMHTVSAPAGGGKPLFVRRWRIFLSNAASNSSCSSGVGITNAGALFPSISVSIHRPWAINRSSAFCRVISVPLACGSCRMEGKAAIRTAFLQ